MDADRPPSEPVAPDAPDSGTEADEWAEIRAAHPLVGEPRPGSEPDPEPVAAETDELLDDLADDLDDDLDDDDGDAMPVPSVVAVVVARGVAPYLEGCLESLAAQDYPDLTVLVVAATEADLRARVAAVLPNAYVREAAPASIATAANEALATVAGAPFLLICHDDTVCEPTAVRLLVEEAYRSNAAIVGPKVVDVERPEILREVGFSVDRFGVPHSEIERDELDQEQHDAVRDVFFVSDVCMLVRADLFAELGGFDPQSDPGARPLDLCWRARLAGARVLVVPDARVRHHEFDGDVDELAVQRTQVRAMLVNSGIARLAWAAPVSFVVHVVEALVHLLRRRNARARVALGAWTANLKNLSAVRDARHAAQARRVVSDSEIHAFQFRGSARVSAYLSESLHAEDRVRALSARGRSVTATASNRFRTIRGIVILAVVAVALVAVRGLLFSGVAAVGELLPWPSTGDLFRTFTSEWRFADLGAQSPAAPAFALAWLARILTLGRPGLPATLMLVAAIPVAIGGAHRLASRTVGPGWPASAAAVVYGVLPLVRNAVEHGSTGALVLFMTAPWVALAVWQAAGLLPHRWPHRRVVILGGLALGLAAAWGPLVILFPAVLALGALLATAVGARPESGLERVVTSAGLVTGIGVTLLFPWPVGWLFGTDRLAALGIAEEATASVAEMLRFFTGSNGAGIAGWAFLVAALGATVLVSDGRAVWAARWWGVAVVSWILAGIPYWLGVPGPSVELTLVPAALAVAMIVGLGVSEFLEEVRTAGLGWQQAVAVGTVGLLGIGLLGFLGDAADGRMHQPEDDWASELEWMPAQRDQGPFRVLWLGRPSDLPGSVHRAGDVGYVLTQDGPGDLRDTLGPGGGSGLALLDGAVEVMAQGDTERFGRVVAPMAIRYVVVLNGPAPGVDGPNPTAARITRSLEGQLDLRSIAIRRGARLFDNAAWLPGDAVLTTAPDRALRGDDQLAIRANRAIEGTALWSQQYSGSWTALDDGDELPHREIAGWTNGYTIDRGTPDGYEFDRQWWRWVALLVQVAIVAAWARRAARRGRGRGRRAPVVPEPVLEPPA